MMVYAMLMLLAAPDNTAIPATWTGTYGLSALTFGKKCPDANTLVVTSGKLTVGISNYSVISVEGSGDALKLKTTDDDDYPTDITLVRKSPDEIAMTTKSEDGGDGPTSYTPCTP